MYVIRYGVGYRRNRLVKNDSYDFAYNVAASYPPSAIASIYTLEEFNEAFPQYKFETPEEDK